MHNDKQLDAIERAAFWNSSLILCAVSWVPFGISNKHICEKSDKFELKGYNLAFSVQFINTSMNINVEFLLKV